MTTVPVSSTVVASGRVWKRVFSEVKERGTVFLTSALQRLVFVLCSIQPLLGIYEEQYMWNCVATEAILQLFRHSVIFESSEFKSDGSSREATDELQTTVSVQYIDSTSLLPPLLLVES